MFEGVRLNREKDALGDGEHSGEKLGVLQGEIVPRDEGEEGAVEWAEEEVELATVEWETVENIGVLFTGSMIPAPGKSGRLARTLRC